MSKKKMITELDCHRIIVLYLTYIMYFKLRQKRLCIDPRCGRHINIILLCYTNQIGVKQTFSSRQEYYYN